MSTPTVIEDNEEPTPPTLSVNIRKGDIKEKKYQEVLIFVGRGPRSRKYAGSLVIELDLVPLFIEKFNG